MGDEAFNVFTGCPCDLTSTMVLRGGTTEQFIDESERSVHDSLMFAKRLLKLQSVIAGGRPELEVKIVQNNININSRRFKLI